MSIEIIDPPAAELFTAEDFGVLRDHLSIGEGEFDDLVLLYASARRAARPKPIFGV